MLQFSSYDTLTDWTSHLSPTKWRLTFRDLFLLTPSQNAATNTCIFTLKPIAILLLILMDDENFRVDMFIELLPSMMVTASAATPLVSGEQHTPLTSNLSDRSKQDNSPQQQKLLSPHNLKPEASIQEQTLLDGGVLGHIEEQVKVGDLGKCLSSPVFTPINLEQNFAAANVGGVNST
jgi:hypothetical protein